LSAPPVFDQQHYELLNRARGDVVRSLLGELNSSLRLETAIDVGCGIGYFSGFLQSMGFDVTAVDGRADNAAEATRRIPFISFHVMNAEDPQLQSLGTFDLVLCFGLLYHLENPFLVIRQLQAMTRSLLLVEGMCVPGEQSTMELLDEGSIDDQGLNYVGFYPSEPCLIKMLYRAGYPFVFRLRQPPADFRFIGTRSRKRERTLLVASKVELTTPSLVLAKEPFRQAAGPANPWDRPLARSFSPKFMLNLLSVRVPRFLRRPWIEKREIIAWYAKRVRNRN
jgi:SAM-dependent methyltransferase